MIRIFFRKRNVCYFANFAELFQKWISLSGLLNINLRLGKYMCRRFWTMGNLRCLWSVIAVSFDRSTAYGHYVNDNRLLELTKLIENIKKAVSI